jgi:hypothetical protein
MAEDKVVGQRPHDLDGERNRGSGLGIPRFGGCGGRKGGMESVLGARACSHRLHGARINFGVGGAPGPFDGRWQWPALHLCEVRVVMAVLPKRYGLLVVAAVDLWRGGY